MDTNQLLNGCWEPNDYYGKKIHGRDLCHESWKAMKPNSDDRFSDEVFEEYFVKTQKNKRLSHIPKEVLHQWIWPFNDDPNSLANYGWINYYDARFHKEEVGVELIINNVHPNKDGMDLVKIRADCQSLSNFYCGQEDIEYWNLYGTWRIPPVILDVSSFSDIPNWTDITFPYQLIEGHNRLGYLHAFYKINNRTTRNKHQVYILKN